MSEIARLNFTRSLLERLYARVQSRFDILIYGTASATQKRSDAKYRGAASVPSGADETSDGSKAIF